MIDLAGTAGIRAFALGGAALLLLALGSLLPPAAEAGGARTSIVNGQATKIKDWPWQVAITVSKRRAPQAKPRARFFCGGSLIAPDLVLTAGHCVADFSRRQIRRLEVVSGRTRLNAKSTGQVATVSGLKMAVNRRGKRRYSQRGGVANWDFALLTLSRPLRAKTIQIAGPGEEDLWNPGRIVSTTGWGVTGSSNRKPSPVLRTATQVMLEDEVCGRINGNLFRMRTMNCLGGPSVNTSTCFGDSGGPLVAPAKDGYRLIGVTSYGDSNCRPILPSTDTRIAGNPIRNWIRRMALRLSGVDVVGRGAVAPPEPQWCRVPRLTGLTLKRARSALRDRGCRLGRVKRVGFGARISATSIVRGWFTPPGKRVRVWVGF